MTGIAWVRTTLLFSLLFLSLEAWTRPYPATTSFDHTIPDTAMSLDSHGTSPGAAMALDTHGTSPGMAVADSQGTSSVISYYEQLHRTPELGKAEHQTSSFLRKKLSEFGYKDLQSVADAPTTVIAVLDSGKPGPVICFRAEMDARKCQEQSGVPYSSTIPGIMHNCGHDAHSAILLETARRLILQKDSLSGKFVLLFQPAEECPGGADDIVSDGILKRLNVHQIFAQHCAPGIAAGTHTLVAGPALAGSNAVEIKLTGRGGHAAQPHERDDLASLSSLITLEFQRIPSRCMDPIKYPTVCSISTAKWNSEQINVAPDTIELAGTVRAFYNVDEKLFNGKSFSDLAKQLVRGLCDAYGAQGEIKIKRGVPPTINDPQLCATVKSLLVKQGIKIAESERGMFAEDFSYYTATIPSAYFGLGIASGNKGRENVHSSKFNIAEECLDKGVELFMAIAKSNPITVQ